MIRIRDLTGFIRFVSFCNRFLIRILYTIM